MWHVIAALLLLLTAGTAPALAQDEEPPAGVQSAPRRPLRVTLSPKGLSVTAQDVPLDAVLREVSRVSGVAVYLEAGLDPTTTRTPTSAALKDLPIEEVLKRLLRDKNFVFGYRADRIDQVRIFGTGSGPFNRLASNVGSPAAGGRRAGVPGRAVRGDGPEADAAALESAALTHPDPAERARALSRLSDTGEDERARDAALSVLDRDQDPEVLREALAVLESSDSVPVDRVMRFASSAQQPDLRLQALELLTEHGGNSAAVRRFVQGLTRDGNAEIRERAQEILEELDDSQQ
jgi:hypothetical protein